MVEFVILGRTELSVAARRINLGHAKQRGLTAALLYHAGTPVRVETIVALLWDGQPPDHLRTNIHSLVSRVRGALQGAGLPHTLVRIPSTGAYRLAIDPLLVDYHRFRRALDRSREAIRAGDPRAATALLTKAMEWWRDEPLADLRGDAADRLRLTMQRTLLDAYRCAAIAHSTLGEYDWILTELEPLTRLYDTDESLAQHWITALCAVGRGAEARTFHSEFRQRYRKKWHTEPSVEPPRPRKGVTPGSPELPNERPSNSPRIAPPRQLPPDLADFTGHDDVLRELDDLVDSVPSGPARVVISGMPGIGKTTLAVHWAHRQRLRFPGGQLYLNAGGYGPTPPIEPVEALGRLLRAFDVPADRIPPGIQERRDRLNQLLADRPALVLVDNVHDSAQVRPLLPSADGCVTVITSRSRLHGLTVREAVRQVTVPPLSEDGCLELLSRVIGGVRVAAEAAALRRLARLSGGVPLAVRIIGEHVAARPQARIGELAEDLNAHLLDCEGADDDEATLRTVFAWSCDAVQPRAASLFAMLGLFPGETIGPEAAAALADLDPALAERLLNVLAKAHLINHDTARRYRFHDLLRRFAADRAGRAASPEETGRAMRRLMGWYLHSAVNAAAVLASEQPPVPDLPAVPNVRPQTFASDEEATAWCEAERLNLGALTRWAAQNGWNRYAWQIQGAVQGIVNRFGHQDDARELQEIALYAADQDGHVLGRIGSLNNLGASHFFLHDYRHAAANFEAGMRLARDIGHPGAETICLHNLAAVHLANGETATAIEMYQRLLRAWRELRNPTGEASTLARLGQAYQQLNRYPEAVELHQRALAIRRRTGELRKQGATHGDLAALFLEMGETTDAYEHCRRALEIHEHTKDDVGSCDALTTMADILRARGMHEEAVRTAQRAVAVSEEIVDSLRRGRALTVLACALVDASQGGAAEHARADALTIVSEVTDPASRALRDRLSSLRMPDGPDG